MTRFEMASFLSGIRNKLTTGAEITAEDVENVRQLVQQMPRPDNHVLYATVKRHYQADVQPEDQDDIQTEQVTAEQIEDAQKKAKANPTIQNIAEYAQLKRSTGE